MVSGSEDVPLQSKAIMELRSRFLDREWIMLSTAQGRLSRHPHWKLAHSMLIADNHSFINVLDHLFNDHYISNSSGSFGIKCFPWFLLFLSQDVLCWLIIWQTFLEKNKQIKIDLQRCWLLSLFHRNFPSPSICHGVANWTLKIQDRLTVLFTLRTSLWRLEQNKYS